MNSKSPWKLILHSRHDHRVWTRIDTSEIYLADHSGDSNNAYGTPDQTDDGPLKVIHTQPIRIGIVNDKYRAKIDVFIERQNKPTTIGVGESVAEWLAEKLGVPLIQPNLQTISA